MSSKLCRSDSQPPSSTSSVNPARVRENQRRSRARRKEYLQELEAKLRRCEALGVQASVNIQVAARAVSAENVRLREENACLRDENEKLSQRLREKAEQGTNNVNAERNHRTSEREGYSGNGPMTSRAVCGPLGDHFEEPTKPLPERHNGELSPQLRSSLPTSLQMNDLETSSGPTQAPISYRDEVRRPLSCGSAAHDWPPTQLETPSQGMKYSQSHQTDILDDASSCEYAAQIITSMRADVTPDDVRADLGCGHSMEEWNKCKVNNAKLFSAMDRYTV